MNVLLCWYQCAFSTLRIPWFMGVSLLFSSLILISLCFFSSTSYDSDWCWLSMASIMGEKRRNEARQKSLMESGIKMIHPSISISIYLRVMCVSQDPQRYLHNTWQHPQQWQQQVPCAAKYLLAWFPTYLILSWTMMTPLPLREACMLSTCLLMSAKIKIQAQQSESGEKKIWSLILYYQIE